MEKMTVKEWMTKLENANPDSPIGLQLTEARKKQKIEMSAVEITVSGVTIHGSVVSEVHEAFSKYEDDIIGIEHFKFWCVDDL